MDDAMRGRNDALQSFWMGFTANRRFKAAPRMLRAASGMYYEAEDG